MRISSGAIADANVTDRTARDLGFVRPFWYNEIRAGRAFVASRQRTPGLGTIQRTQLFNPVGSAIAIIVHRVLVTMGTSANIILAQDNTARTTDLATELNLLSGGAGAVGQLREDEAAGGVGTAFYRHLVAANEVVSLIEEWSVELGAGEGLTAQSQSADVNLSVTFEWVEI